MLWICLYCLIISLSPLVFNNSHKISHTPSYSLWMSLLSALKYCGVVSTQGTPVRPSAADSFLLPPRCISSYRLSGWGSVSFRGCLSVITAGQVRSSVSRTNAVDRTPWQPASVNFQRSCFPPFRGLFVAPCCIPTCTCLPFLVLFAPPFSKLSTLLCISLLISLCTVSVS